MKNKLPYKTFDLFASYDADVPFIEVVYRWITSVGRYIVIGVEMVVLSAFVARFILDQNLNDLTDKINDNNSVLQSTQSQEKSYRDIQNKVMVVKAIQKQYDDKLLREIPKLYTMASDSLKIVSVDYSNEPINNLVTETLLVTIQTQTSQAPDFEKFINANILNSTNKIPNPNINLKLLNVVNSTTDINSYTYTYKISVLS